MSRRTHRSQSNPRQCKQQRRSSSVAQTLHPLVSSGASNAAQHVTRTHFRRILFQCRYSSLLARASHCAIVYVFLLCRCRVPPFRAHLAVQQTKQRSPVFHSEEVKHRPSVGAEASAETVHLEIEVQKDNLNSHSILDGARIKRPLDHLLLVSSVRARVVIASSKQLLCQRVEQAHELDVRAVDIHDIVSTPPLAVAIIAKSATASQQPSPACCESCCIPKNDVVKRASVHVLITAMVQVLR